MTTLGESIPTPENQAYPPLPLDEDLGPVSLFQEINERRARVENAELLQHLRGLLAAKKKRPGPKSGALLSASAHLERPPARELRRQSAFLAAFFAGLGASSSP